ncbi:hypothetical protein IAT38_005254 [Cryptococcus sp. DSM 104549]
MHPALLLLPLLPLSLADPTPYHTIHQRFLPASPLSASSASPPPFSKLGSIFIPRDNGVVGTVTLGSLATKGVETVKDDGKGWYQVAVQVGDDDEDEWLIASTRSCYLSSPPTVKLLLNGTLPLSISVHPESPSQACEPSPVCLLRDIRYINFQTYSPSVTKNPLLAPPPTVDTTGAPQEPPPEKSFTQKYWMYIVGIGLFFAISMGPDEPRGGRGGEGGGGGGR